MPVPSEAEAREALEVMLDVFGYGWTRKELDAAHGRLRVASFVEQGMSEEEARAYAEELRKPFNG